MSTHCMACRQILPKQTPQAINQQAKTRMFQSGINDGFDGLQPAWLGNESYNLGYSIGARSAAYPVDSAMQYIGLSNAEWYMYQGVLVTGIWYPELHRVGWVAQIPRSA